MILNQRCCWMTTCRVTGMPNGYTVSLPTKRFLRQEEEYRLKHSSSQPFAALRAKVADAETAAHEAEEEEENYKLNEAFTGKPSRSRLIADK